MERTELETIISILRRSTILVKVMPFLFTFFYLIGIFSYMWLPQTLISCLDLTFYISPVVIIYELILSKIFHLCKWHKFECILPFFGVIPIFVDNFIIEIDAYGQLVNWIIVVFIITLSLINAYFVFIKH